MDSGTELSVVEGWEGLQAADGELRGKAQGQQVGLELSLPRASLPVEGLPFLSLRASCPAEEWAEKNRPGD